MAPLCHAVTRCNRPAPVYIRRRLCYDYGRGHSRGTDGGCADGQQEGTASLSETARLLHFLSLETSAATSARQISDLHRSSGSSRTLLSPPASSSSTSEMCPGGSRISHRRRSSTPSWRQPSRRAPKKAARITPTGAKYIYPDWCGRSNTRLRSLGSFPQIPPRAIDGTAERPSKLCSCNWVFHKIG